MPDCSNSLPVDMLIGLYGSHHINIPTKHFNFQLSIFNSSSIQAIVYFQLSIFNSSSIQAIVHFQFSIFNFQFLIFLPSLCLRSRFAPMNDPAATPKRLFNGIGNAPLRYSYSCYSSIYPQSVIRVGNAMRNSSISPLLYPTPKCFFEL